MVSAPMVRASPGAWSQNRLWSFQSNSFECMRYGSASDVWMRQLEQCRPITEVEGQSIGNETNEQCRSFSAPLVRASPGAWSQNRLWSFQSNSFECMRYGSA